jgi:hypothetical protein
VSFLGLGGFMSDIDMEKAWPKYERWVSKLDWTKPITKKEYEKLLVQARRLGLRHVVADLETKISRMGSLYM